MTLPPDVHPESGPSSSPRKRDDVPNDTEVMLVPAIEPDSLPRPSMAVGDVPLPLTPPALDAAAVHDPASDVLVPARSRPTDRMISGIDLIDFGVGGLLPNKIYVAKGDSGAGKSILGLQFLAKGLELQEPGILITDQKPDNVLAQAAAIGFRLDDAVKRGQLSILNPSARYFELVESPADIQAIVEELADYIRQIAASRVVIDPVFALINTRYSAQFSTMVTQSLVNALEELPATTLLIAGDDGAPELNPILHLLEHNAFGVIAFTKDKESGGRLMRLSKLRYANSENLSAPYRILNGRGLINYHDDQPVQDIAQPWEAAGTVRRSVLMVGASPEAIRKVRTALGEDYELSAEPDIQAGIERARRDQPAVVLVSPSRNAGAIAAILQLAQESASSIAFLSPSTNRKSDRVLYLRAGADDFIVEPFSPDELRARVDALIRRSGRRLTIRDSGVDRISAEELSLLMSSGETAEAETSQNVILEKGGEDVAFDPAFDEKLRRNLVAVSKLDTPFALYWLKSEDRDPLLSHSLASLCRQEDILCHNRNGEFVAILTGTDQHGVQGFENRLQRSLADRFREGQIAHGFRLYEPGKFRAESSS